MKTTTQITEGLTNEEKGKFYELNENLGFLVWSWIVFPFFVFAVGSFILYYPFLFKIIEYTMPKDVLTGIIHLFVINMIIPAIIFLPVGKLIFLKKTKFYIGQIDKIISTNQGKKAYEILKKEKSGWINAYNRARKRKFYHWLP